MAKKKPVHINIEALEKDLLSQYGETSFFRGSEISAATRIPIGHPSLDSLLGGGIPRGKITEIYGPPSSSKSCLLYNAIGQAQKGGEVAVLIDAEKSYDPMWAALNGVDNAKLRVFVPPTGEEAYEVAEQYLKIGAGIVGIDSIAQVVPRAELDGEVSDANIGLAARLNAKAMRRLTTLISPTTALVLVNQTRANVSTMSFAGPAEVTSGGKAIPFYASLRLNVRRVGWVKSGEEATGASFRCRVDKCKITGIRAWSTAHFDVDFENGLDVVKDYLYKGIAAGLVEKRKSWFIFDEESKLHGESAAKEFIIDNNLIPEWKEKLNDRK